MTFKEFERIVKNKYPEARLCKHGEFAGSKINVAVEFNPKSKVYQYNGTYCDVLNRIGIKAIYKHTYESMKNNLKRYIEKNGKEDFFGFINDHTERIASLQDEIREIEEDYIIV